MINTDYRLPAVYEPPGDWRQKAACRGLDPDMFVGGSVGGNAHGVAKAVCATCPSVQPCAIYAISLPDVVGVWGGLSGQERIAARKVLGRMCICAECRNPFHTQAIAGPAPTYCSDDCRHVVRLRSKTESHRKAEAVA